MEICTGIAAHCTSLHVPASRFVMLYYACKVQIRWKIDDFLFWCSSRTPVSGKHIETCRGVAAHCPTLHSPGITLSILNYVRNI